MEWPRHCVSRALPVQKIVDRAVAGRMPDRLFIGRLEIVDVQHLARTGSLGKARQQSLFPGQRHVLALTATDRFRLQRLDPAAVIGHVGAVHGAQRNTHRLRDRGLGHSALAQQYHLNAQPLSLRHFPTQRRLQLPNLALRAFDHPSPPKQMARWNHKISLPSGTKLPQTPRFNKLWKRYKSQLVCRVSFCSAAIRSKTRYGTRSLAHYRLRPDERVSESFDGFCSSRAHAFSNCERR